jgi:hypothetical protein
MIDNMYAKYLLADRLNGVAGGLGLAVEHIEVGNGYGSYTFDVDIQCGIRRDYTPEASERAAVMLMEAMPELQLRRSSGLIYLSGTTSLGFTYRFYTGTGMCERVQVGTRTVKAQPAIEAYEEPIWEVMCPDPLRELVSA